MNKLVQFYIFALLAVCSLPVLSGNTKSEQMKIGYTRGDLCLSLGTGRRVVAKNAIQFPASYLEQLKGNNIVKLRVGIGEPLTEQQNYVFITHKLDGEPDYIQPVEQLNSGWNEIVLDTPFEIKGEELFIGYKYATRSMAISFDGGETNNYANWIAFSETDENFTWSHHEGSGSLNIQAIVEGVGLPQHDAAIVSVESGRYAQAGNKYPVVLLVRNMAAASINSLDVTYTIDGQDPVTKTIGNLNISSNDLSLVHVDDAIIQEEGIYDMSVSIEKVNGVSDENGSDNQGRVSRIIAKPDYTQRKVLLEQFSTEKCNNCPASHKVIATLLKYKRQDVIWLVHHAGFYEDDLTIDESKSYTFFYGNAQRYAPAAMLDRINLAQFGAIDGDDKATPAPVFSTSSNIKKLVDERLNTSALITVDIDHKYDMSSRLLTVSAFGEIPSGDVARLKGNNVRLNIYLIEDSIPGLQSGIEGEYIHNHAIRKVLTNVWGDEIRFTDGKYHSQEYTFTVPETWKEGSMRIIAFVANSDWNNPNNGQVFNAEEVTLLPEEGTWVQIQKTDTSLTIYPTSESLFINGEYDSGVIYNATGGVVRIISKPESKLSVAAMESGVYFIKFNVDGRSVVRKFLKHK